MNYGEAFAASVKEYLSINRMTSLGQINGPILADLAQRFQDHHEAQEKIAKKKERKFTQPTPQEVTDFSASIGYPMNGEAWCLHYECKGWVTSGSTKMRNWRAAVHKWKAEGWICGGASNGLKTQGNGTNGASLGALMMAKKAVEAELDAILYPGGMALKIVPQAGTEKRAKAEDLERQYHSLNRQIAAFAT